MEMTTTPKDALEALDFYLDGLPKGAQPSHAINADAMGEWSINYYFAIRAALEAQEQGAVDVEALIEQATFAMYPRSVNLGSDTPVGATIKWLAANGHLRQPDAVGEDVSDAVIKLARAIMRELDTGGGNYLTVRMKVAELSGIPAMAVTFDEHIKAIKAALEKVGG